MGALQDIANLLIHTFFQLYLLVLMLRLLLQLVRADFYNPVSQFVVKVSGPLLNPLRRIIPGFGGIDIACIVLILVVQIVSIFVLIAIDGKIFISPLILVWAVLGTLGMLVNIYFVAIIASIIISWVAPGTYHPIVLLLHQLTEPVMRPFRNLIPPIGGLDLSPILVFLVLNVLQILLNHVGNAFYVASQYVIGL